MSCLSFASPIISGDSPDLSFKFVSAFDNYFSYSGRKYQVISHGSGNQYTVKEVYEKPSIPLNILKAVSLLTGFIPLIMFVGKVIARSHYRFNLEKSESAGLSTGLPAKPSIDNPNRDVERKKKGTHLPGNTNQVCEQAEKFASYKQKAIANLRDKRVECDDVDFTLNDNQKESLKRASKNIFLGGKGPGYKILRGGCHAVILLDSVPGFVFKVGSADFCNEEWDVNRKNCEAYCERSQEARELTQRESFYLLHVPQSQVIEVDGKCFVMEKKCQLENGTFAFQRGLHRSLISDAETRDFMHEAYKQLAKFIGQFKFRDVKYDNMPISKDGKLELFDLDTDGAIGGYTTGGAQKNDGLFNYLPTEWVKEFKNIAIRYVPKDDHARFSALVNKIVSRLQVEERLEKDYTSYLGKHQITNPTQQINPEIEVNCYEKIEKLFAKVIIEEINSQLATDQSYSPQEGRKVNLAINVNDAVTEKAKKLFEEYGCTWKYMSSSDSDYTYKNHLLPQVLEGLKKSGAIFSYVIDRSMHVSVRC